MSISRSKNTITQEEVDAALANFLAKGGSITHLQDPRITTFLNNEFDDPFVSDDDSSINPDHLKMAHSEF
jgi:hypothetical protein